MWKMAGGGGFTAACGRPNTWAGECRRLLDAGVRRKAGGWGKHVLLLS